MPHPARVGHRIDLLSNLLDLDANSIDLRPPNVKGEEEKGNRETLDLNLYRHYKTEIEFVLVEVVEEPAAAVILA
ncbi:uncharacterized protein A4U43_C01F20090 [Asparagus officinalis]|uniref:Uncharacterized protein n=1 Tax=Asparagus officinalis TaxID=4686 RepID=A0A5P1FVA3_ASPOF|nr:uncharacterized protein A4U43_C01F20090 [Asparagus officinalis]